jgi:short-subunit dehydrogenase
MLARKHGYILLVSSIGAFQPSPTYAAYSAAKAYVLSLGEALHYELRGAGVSVTVVCPGVTRTEFLQVAGQTPSLYQRLSMMDSAAVARIGIAHLLRRSSCVVPGFMNSLFALGTRLISRQMQATAAHLFMTRY